MATSEVRKLRHQLAGMVREYEGHLLRLEGQLLVLRAKAARAGEDAGARFAGLLTQVEREGRGGQGAGVGRPWPAWSGPPTPRRRAWPISRTASRTRSPRRRRWRRKGEGCGAAGHHRGRGAPARGACRPARRTAGVEAHEDREGGSRCQRMNYAPEIP